jgi:hypothetical protein
VGLARRGGPLLALALLAACNSSGSPPSPTTAAPPPAASSTAAPPSPTTTVAATTTTEALVPVGSPDAAANALLAAWRQGDRVAAGRIATPDAVAALFFALHPQSFSDRGCQDPLAGRSACAFGVGAGLVQLQTVMALAGGWYVESVTVNP